MLKTYLHLYESFSSETVAYCALDCVHGVSDGFCLHNDGVVKLGIFSENVCPSVRLAVCHTHGLRLNGSRYRKLLYTIQ